MQKYRGQHITGVTGNCCSLYSAVAILGFFVGTNTYPGDKLSFSYAAQLAMELVPYYLTEVCLDFCRHFCNSYIDGNNINKRCLVCFFAIC